MASMTRARSVLTAAVGATALMFVLAQLVPYGPDRTGSPTHPVAWSDERTAELADRACLDCHSDQTRWPAYSRVAPFSWIVARHVEEGRAVFDVSRPGIGEAGEAGETVREGEMPPWYYTLLHPEARLTDEEKDALAAGLDRTFGGEGENEDGD